MRAWELTADLCLYEPHHHGRGIGKMADRAVLQTAAAGIPDHRGDQPPFVLEIQTKYPGNQEEVRKMAIIYDGQVKMAHLAIAAGYSVNGVARLHTEILEKQD